VSLSRYLTRTSEVAPVLPRKPQPTQAQRQMISKSELMLTEAIRGLTKEEAIQLIGGALAHTFPLEGVSIAEKAATVAHMRTRK